MKFNLDGIDKFEYAPVNAAWHDSYESVGGIQGDGSCFDFGNNNKSKRVELESFVTHRGSWLMWVDSLYHKLLSMTA